MKKLIYLFSLSFLILLSSCGDKETEGISRITYYAEITLEQGEEMAITVGEGYVEPGYTAMEGENDITDQVVVSGNVDGNTVGAYEVNYTVSNVDGFESVVTRLVLVVPEDLSSEELAGSYSGTTTYGTFSKACQITKIDDGVFKGTDFFGGWYVYGREIGSRYALVSHFYLNADNTYVALKTNSPWGPWGVENGVYDPAATTLNHQAVHPSGFGFDVVLTKEVE